MQKVKVPFINFLISVTSSVVKRFQQSEGGGYFKQAFYTGAGVFEGLVGSTGGTFSYSLFGDKNVDQKEEWLFSKIQML